MATEQTITQSNAANAIFTITDFSFIDSIDVKVSVTPSGGSTDLKTAGVHYNIVGNTVTFTTGNLPPLNAVVMLYRDTVLTSAKATYHSGSTIRAEDLNDNQNQFLYSLEEKYSGVVIKNAYEAQSNTNAYTDAEKTKLSGIDTGAKDDQTLSELSTLGVATKTGTETLTNKTLTSPVINDMSGTAVVTSGTSTSDTKTYSAKRAGEIFYGKDTLSEIQSGESWSAADDKIATTSAIDARITDLVDDVGGFVPIANETSFPAANPDVNNGTGTLVSIKEFASSHTPSGGTVTIANGAGSGNTVTITGCGSTVLGAGYGGIVETTSTLHTYTFHRLAPKATEVTTVAGNITNINSCANNETNINAAVSNASNINSAVSNASNINAVVSNATNINTVAGNNTNINTVAGANSNITTVTTNIANINSVGGSISNVNTVASNLASVNNFADQYRIASSQPSSSLNTGDLYFDTTANELRVYNGSSWQGGVTATGNLVSKADIGASSGVPGAGSSGQYLQTNGSGTLSWQTISTAITETDQTIASSLTITTGKNAMSVGDVTLASGVILTIPVNSKYILVG